MTTPTLVISTPQPNTTVAATGFTVSGSATGSGQPEPTVIESITVKVDGHAPVNAVLTRGRSHNQAIVFYSARVIIVGGSDPHRVTVTASNDVGGTMTQFIWVFTAAASVFGPPAFEFDVASMIDPNVPKYKDRIAEEINLLVGQLQQQLLPLSDLFQLVGKVLAGPNWAVEELLVDHTIHAGFVIRFGFWLVDSDFELTAANPPDFCLPLLSPAAGLACRRQAST